MWSGHYLCCFLENALSVGSVALHLCGIDIPERWRQKARVFFFFSVVCASEKVKIPLFKLTFSQKCADGRINPFQHNVMLSASKFFTPPWAVCWFVSFYVCTSWMKGCKEMAGELGGVRTQEMLLFSVRFTSKPCGSRGGGRQNRTVGLFLPACFSCCSITLETGDEWESSDGAARPHCRSRRRKSRFYLSLPAEPSLLTGR